MSDITDSDIYNFITKILKEGKSLLTNEEVLELINNERAEKLELFEVENLYTKTFSYMKEHAKKQDIVFTNLKRLMLYNLMIKYPGAHASFFKDELKFRHTENYNRFYNAFKKYAEPKLPKDQKNLFTIHEKLKTNYAYYLIKCVVLEKKEGKAIQWCMQDELDSLSLNTSAWTKWDEAKQDIQSLINKGIKTIKIYNNRENSMQEVRLEEVLEKLK